MINIWKQKILRHSRQTDNVLRDFLISRCSKEMNSLGKFLLSEVSHKNMGVCHPSAKSFNHNRIRVSLSPADSAIGTSAAQKDIH